MIISSKPIDINNTICNANVKTNIIIGNLGYLSAKNQKKTIANINININNKEVARSISFIVKKINNVMVDTMVALIFKPNFSAIFSHTFKNLFFLCVIFFFGQNTEIL